VILGVTNDGSFATKEIKQAYKALAKKYHPDQRNDRDVVSEESAKKRWTRLVKAYKTLTKEDMFNNWRYYGNPEGSMAIKAMELALPNWLAGEDSQTILIGGFFATLILVALGAKVWVFNNENINESGISIDSKTSMRDFMLATLEDNPKNERTSGFSDVDVVEIWQTSVEVN